MANIHSHRSEAYVILSILLLLSEYSKYLKLPFNNKCTLYYDNTEIVKKVQKTKKTASFFKPSYKISEHETIITIQKYLPHQLIVIQLYSHQDKIKGTENLTFPEKLNDLAASVADTYARSPINNHIPFTPLAIYFDTLYPPNNYLFHLCRLSFQNDANEYIKKKYNYNARISTDID